MDDVRHRRATSFGAVADVYELGRPSYPEAALEWVLDPAPGRRVVDLGAGTGKLTHSLVDMGCEVTAIEPLAGMRAQLEALLPAVTVLEGSAESMPVADGSADAIFVAQAFHWFEPVPALDEMARVLAPGGVVGLLWNSRDDAVPWVAELSRILVLPTDTVSKWDWAGARPASEHPLFDGYEERRFPNPEIYTPERLVQWAQSSSVVTTLPPEEQVPILDQIAELTRTHPALRGKDTFPLPMVTMTVRSVRSRPT
jgi:ubiquinone/menaquinone biosynthesis C-methylase UbiE